MVEELRDMYILQKRMGIDIIKDITRINVMSIKKKKNLKKSNYKKYIKYKNRTV